ncbi:MAG: prepilin-type N-terminal cleavage/methylation domain-containing protein [Desulfobacteraceae bacterium]|nr:prepilin-type N-terminal cleavage/methylation domain-containing protein [Desulfobacteraceae bacterium]
MKTKGQKGFTLIEVVIVSAISVIMVLATGMLLFTSQGSWNKALKKANLQRDASYAMLIISDHIKAGRSTKVDGSSKAIKIYKDEKWVRFSLADGGKDLKYQFEGKPETIINDNVEHLVFNVEGNIVGIDLKLKEDNLQTHLASTVMMRNYEE